MKIYISNVTSNAKYTTFNYSSTLDRITTSYNLERYKNNLIIYYR